MSPLFYCFFLDRINRINLIFSFGRSPEESAQTPIAFGEGEHILIGFQPISGHYKNIGRKLVS